MIEKISEYLSYSPETGKFIWTKSPARTLKQGDEAGKKCSSRYAKIQFKGKCYLAHRVAWFMTYGQMPTMIDHINGDTFDNRIENLRHSNAFENGRNKLCHRNGKLFGAHFLRGKYHGTFARKGKHFHVGVFDSEKEAHAAVFGFLKAKEWLEEKHLSENFT